MTGIETESQRCGHAVWASQQRLVRVYHWMLSQTLEMSNVNRKIVFRELIKDVRDDEQAMVARQYFNRKIGSLKQEIVHALRLQRDLFSH